MRVGEDVPPTAAYEDGEDSDLEDEDEDELEDELEDGSVASEADKSDFGWSFSAVRACFVLCSWTLYSGNG